MTRREQEEVLVAAFVVVGREVLEEAAKRSGISQKCPPVVFRDLTKAMNKVVQRMPDNTVQVLVDVAERDPVALSDVLREMFRPDLMRYAAKDFLS